MVCKGWPVKERTRRKEEEEIKAEAGQHTNLIKHLVALVEDKVLDVLELQGTLLDESKDTTRGADQDVGAELLVAENVLISLDGHTTVEHLRANLGKVLAEASVIVLDLESELTSVAEDNDSNLAGSGLDLLERREDKDSSLSHTRLGLAQNVHTQNRLGDALLLNY